MKILYVTPVAMTMGFFPPHIRLLQEAGHTVELACNMDEPLKDTVLALGCKTYSVPFSRSPLSGQNIAAYRELRRIIEEGHYDIVHTHTPVASALVRIACRKQRKSGLRVFYTAHGFHFSKAKGQNFLTQSWVPREIAAAAGIDETCGVLEVGPGIGPLTQELCSCAGKVTAVEIDRSLQPILAETMAGNDNLEIIFGDILKTDIPALVKEQFAGLRPMACANLPYYITTPIIMQLLVTVVLMVPLTPGGVGVAEVSLGVFYALIIPAGIVGIFVLIYRFIFYYFNLIVGFIASMLIIRREAKEKVTG